MVSIDKKTGELTMLSQHLALAISATRDGFAAIHSDEEGQGMTEYIIILVAVVIVCILISVMFGNKIKSFFSAANTEMNTLSP
jgi:Flp pilus assembly pilin Flp